MQANTEYTPMMRQYLEVKQKLGDTIVFYRLGDFYEMFFEDAKLASNELDLVLTGRDAGVEERVPMCGIPYHAAAGYIQRLVTKGYKIAIVEQMESPAEAKGIVRREVVKIITPGTYVDEQDDRSCNYIASIAASVVDYVVTLADMASGETCYRRLDKTALELEQFLLSMNVKEVVIGPEFDRSVLERIAQQTNVRISVFEQSEELFEYSYLLFGVQEPLVYHSFYRLLQYLKETTKQSLAHLLTITELDSQDELKMDYYTKRNLELTMTVRNQTKQGTLWHFLDHCKSAMGSRLLRKWIEHPLTSLKAIHQRLDGVSFLVDNFLVRDEIQEHMKEVYDIERIVAKLAYQNTNARELLRLKNTLLHAPKLLDAMQACDAYRGIVQIDSCGDLLAILANAFLEDAPLSIRDGGIFAQGYDTQLDELREISRNGKQFIADIESKERERTGIKSLKIGYNRVFGYYIEVSKANLNVVDDSFGYIRKQTLTNCERFVTQELKEKEEAILHAEEKVITLEYQLFMQLVEKIQPYLPNLQRLASVLATIDVLQSLAKVSSEYGYVRPVFQGSDICIVKGRHPILEKYLKDHLFVSNDCMLKEEESIMLITGPNMGGKSTYMRQVGLLVIMAQMGCFVSAASCQLPLFDQIFTRIGANDDLLGGQSTFMVEMMEANHALMQATSKSLILFDEIGRGTSTYDGMALAQAMMEYICQVLHAKTLFSTHYHELTALAETYPQIRNVHVVVEEQNDHVTFLYQVKEGKADRSYGINVARLAKLPEAVLIRAKQILDELEAKQPLLFEQYEKPVLVKENRQDKRIRNLLEEIDPYQTTPMEALQLLNRLKELVREDEVHG